MIHFLVILADIFVARTFLCVKMNKINQIEIKSIETIAHFYYRTLQFSGTKTPEFYYAID